MLGVETAETAAGVGPAKVVVKVPEVFDGEDPAEKRVEVAASLSKRCEERTRYRSAVGLIRSNRVLLSTYRSATLVVIAEPNKTSSVQSGRVSRVSRAVAQTERMVRLRVLCGEDVRNNNKVVRVKRDTAYRVFFRLTACNVDIPLGTGARFCSPSSAGRSPRRRGHWVLHAGDRAN